MPRWIDYTVDASRIRVTPHPEGVMLAFDNVHVLLTGDLNEIEGVGAWIMNTVEDKRSAAIASRLEYLRGELRAERISYSGLAELQGLAEHIDPGDVELLEAAGVPE